MSSKKCFPGIFSLGPLKRPSALYYNLPVHITLAAPDTMKRFKLFSILVSLAAAGLFFSPLPAIAHPHVFIAQNTRIVFDDKGLAGFRVSWAFDEMFSSLIAADFDADQNGKLDKKEVRVIREKAFGYIAEHNYYIHVDIDGKPFAVKYVTEFNAFLKGGKLHYDFFVPCHVRATAHPKKIKLSPYDPAYYSSIYFPDNTPVTFKNRDGFVIDASIKRDMSTLIYYDTVNPLAVFMSFSVKS